MAVEIRVPPFGESVVEATVHHWLKQEGDSMVAGEPVVELETEKVSTEIAAEEAGVLARILRREGETVRPGDVLGIVDRQAQDTSRETQKLRVSPVAQRVAQELEVDLSQLRGSGPAGRIVREDVEAFAREQQALPVSSAAGPASPDHEAAPTSPVPSAPASPVAFTSPMATTAAGAEETRQRLSRRRLTIARRLVEAQQTTAMLTTFNEIDMQAVVELRRRRRESFRRATGADLGYMPFFVRAVIGALRAVPQLNSELQGEELVLKQFYDIGIAIADPEGLVVPVLRQADRMGFAQIENAIDRFVQKAREHKLTLDDLRGGTFTITNGGVFGSLLSTPILNPPQTGILGMHKISERPVAIAGQVVVHPTMFVALTYDHRVVDGREAVVFLVRVKELIEDPERLLLEA